MSTSLAHYSAQVLDRMYGSKGGSSCFITIFDPPGSKLNWEPCYRDGKKLAMKNRAIAAKKMEREQ